MLCNFNLTTVLLLIFNALLIFIFKAFNVYENKCHIKLFLDILQILYQNKFRSNKKKEFVYFLQPFRLVINKQVLLKYF